jgi:hypothetical protein
VSIAGAVDLKSLSVPGSRFGVFDALKLVPPLRKR